MNISELQPRQSNVEVEGTISEIGEIREFNKFGKQGRVANAILNDDSGKVKLSLWNEQIDQINVGDKVKILKGYVSEFQGELQLTTGKFGTLEVTKAADTKKDYTTTETKSESNSNQATLNEHKKEESETGNLEVEEEELF